MRSFSSCQATDMDRLFWLSLLLTHLPVIDSMKKAKGCLSQSEKVTWRKKGQAAALFCSIRPECSAKDLYYEWFVFKENGHIRLDLNSNKYSLAGGSLRIKPLNLSDSGIYHCAAASHSRVPACCTQHVGPGATLVVTEQVKTVGFNLLWLAFVLLAIYSLAIVAFIIVKKCGRNINVRKMCRTDKNNSNKKKVFRNVLQEMNSRRNLENSKQTANGNSSRAEAENGEFGSSSDGIYQNV